LKVNHSYSPVMKERGSKLFKHFKINFIVIITAKGGEMNQENQNNLNMIQDFLNWMINKEFKSY